MGGGNLPLIRFNGFNALWIVNKIGKITTSYSGGTPSAGIDTYYGGNIPFIRSGEIHQEKTEMYITEKGYQSSSAKMVSKGTILYAMYGATSGEVDVSKIDGAINQAILAIIPKDEIDVFFLSYVLQSRKEHIVNTFIQGGQGNLSASLIKEYEICYPTDINEQQKIASFFRSLDKKIFLQTQRIEKLKQMKSACLNKMIA